MNMINRVSVTDMHHSVLLELEAGIFTDLVVTEADGGTQYYDFDTFRRLYNDAVESMRHYRKLAAEYYNLAEQYHDHCNSLDLKLRELSGDPE